MPNKILVKDFLASLQNKIITDEVTENRIRIVNTDYQITENKLDYFELKISLIVVTYDDFTGTTLDRRYNLFITKRDLKSGKDLDADIEAISEPLQHEIMSGIQVRAREIANISQQ